MDIFFLVLSSFLPYQVQGENLTGNINYSSRTINPIKATTPSPDSSTCFLSNAVASQSRSAVSWLIHPSSFTQLNNAGLWTHSVSFWRGSVTLAGLGKVIHGPANVGKEANIRGHAFLGQSEWRCGLTQESPVWRAALIDLWPRQERSITRP